MRIRILPLVTLLTLSACGTGEQEPEDVAGGTIEEGQMPMEGMPGMAGMGGVRADAMMQEMEAHMAAMAAAGADSMIVLMPQHRQMTANMLAEMNREMREMNMAADEDWTAVVDSLRQDLTRMPDMGAGEMQSFMPAHNGRIQRMMEMHRAMMATMRM